MTRNRNTMQLLTRILLTTLCLGAVCASVSFGQGTTSSGSNSPAAPLPIVHVQGNIYLIPGAGGNITVQVGEDGVLLVDAGLASASDRVLAAIHTVSDKPIRYIINTHIHPDHVGGNEAIAAQGKAIAGGNVVGDIGASAAQGATIIAFQTILDRMSAPDSKDKAPQRAWPTDTYSDAEKKLFFNGEAIEIIHQPYAHTDGDSMVFFRRSDVVSTGDLVTLAGYPIIDTERGGTIQGIIAAFNRLIYQITIPAAKQEGGTMVIPGHGRLCDQADLVYYQEMLIIIRDRIQNMIDKGMTVEEVQAAKPTRDYDPLYGNAKGLWTPDKFVATIYQNLKDHPQKSEKAAAAVPEPGSK
jgi:glyoxylase-like metal-dependent hydrolase (beta-lactamase superfamily II)